MMWLSLALGAVLVVALFEREAYVASAILAAVVMMCSIGVTK